MKKIGNPGEVVRPGGFLVVGGDRIPLTSFSSSLSVGSIPTCRVGIPIEFIRYIPKQATKTMCRVVVGEENDLSTIFTGYVSGRSGRISSNRVEAGVSLVHPARDLDTMRMLAPGMHTSGLDDWSNNRAPRDGGGNSGANTFFRQGGGSLPSQLIAGIANRLNFWSRQTSVGSAQEVSFRRSGYADAIKMLNSIIVLNGNIGDLNLSSNLAVTVNDHALAIVEGSRSSQSSLWNSITQLFSDFDLYMICDNKGQVLVSTNLANFKPAGENYFYSDQIYSFDQSSSFGRNVSEVIMISQGFMDTNGVIGKFSQSTLVSYPPDAAQDVAGGTMCMSMPQWLTPFNQITVENSKKRVPPSAANPKPPGGKVGPPTIDKSIAGAQLAMAKAYYNNERDKWRTMSFTGPIVPDAIPGTTIWVEPYSSVVALSGGSVSDGSVFSGYVSEVQHTIDVGGKSMYTTFVLRNVSEVSEALNIDTHPVYSDAKSFIIE